MSDRDNSQPTFETVMPAFLAVPFWVSTGMVLYGAAAALVTGGSWVSPGDLMVPALASALSYCLGSIFEITRPVYPLMTASVTINPSPGSGSVS